MKIRYNTNKFDRDPSIYLGIDEFAIPITMFRGVEYSPGDIISPTSTGEILFYISEDSPEVTLVNGDSNSYVSIADVEDVEEWFIVNKKLDYINHK